MKSNSYLRVFGPSILIALTVHILTAYFLVYLNFSLLTKKNKTIPILLLSADTKAKKSNKQSSHSSMQDSSSEQNYLSTTGSSDFSILDQAKNPKKRDASTQLVEPSKIHTQFTNLPNIVRPNRSQATRAQQARQGLQNIFSQQQKTYSEVRQISTRSSKQLDEYELLLVKQLVRAELYDQYHAIMAITGKEQVDFEITLILFQNGAIKNASINKSSNIREIDQLAIRTAYAASPYPPPPKKDLQMGFRYSIPISYHKQQ